MKTTIANPALSIRMLATTLLAGVVLLATLAGWRSAAATDAPVLAGVAWPIGGECLGRDPECRPAPPRCERVSRCAIVAPAAKRLSAPPFASPSIRRLSYPAAPSRVWEEDPRVTRGDRYLLTRRLRI